ncbi:MAG: amidohydrolase family protein, partial [Alphaproteobacteria bacterium]
PLCAAIRAAAAASATGLTLLPVASRRGGFGGKPTSGAQARFVLDADRYARMIATLSRRHRGDAQVRIGVAPHSLRAVDPADLAATLAAIDAIDAKAPVHIHVAETRREVEDCVAWSGARPVAWLLDNAPVGERWCLVHATHMDAEETRRLAASGAVAGICPTTEANLGDGFFPAGAYAAAGGRIGFGSDSNVSTSPVEELRWYEYGQRLASGQRNLSAPGSGASTGMALLRAALAGGAQALGRPVGAVAPGFRADLGVLVQDPPLLAERMGDALVDAWIFSGNDRVVRDVVVGGQWVVREGHHAHEEQARADFARALRKLTREE